MSLPHLTPVKLNRPGRHVFDWMAATAERQPMYQPAFETCSFFLLLFLPKINKAFVNFLVG